MKNNIIIFTDDMRIGATVEIAPDSIITTVIREEVRPQLDRALSLMAEGKLAVMKEAVNLDNSISVWFEPVAIRDADFATAFVKAIEDTGAYALASGPAQQALFEFFDTIEMSAYDRVKLTVELPILSDGEAMLLLDEKKKSEAGK